MVNISTTEVDPWAPHVQDMWFTIQLLCVLHKLCHIEMKKHGPISKY